MKWKGIIFDRDGTLFNSLPVILEAFNYAILPFTDRRPTDAEWFAAFGPAEPEVIATFIGEEKSQQAFTRFYDYYQQHISSISLFTGIRELLEKIKTSAIKVGLFTGGGKISTEFCLEQCNVRSYFDVLITGDDVIRPKPDPEGIRKAMQFLKIQPAELLVVGDAGADILAGKAAGAATALARWTTVALPHDLPSRPDYTFHSVSEMEHFLFGGSGS